MNALSDALDYARAGWLVFPAPPGTKMSYKSARWSGGRRWGATTDAEEIKRDWARWPHANVCIVTGAESGIFVTETDNKNGVNGDATLNALQEHYGALPNTMRARSPSGSIHWYWKYPNDGRVVRNDVARKLGAGVDVRGDGGMVVAPPSVRDGKCYEWINVAKVVSAPDWLLALVAAKAVVRVSEEQETAPLPMVAAAVAVIPTELNWHDRNKIGMAVWLATNGEGFNVWDDWLRRSGRYNAMHARKRWEGITNSRPNNIGVGTLIYLANNADAAWLERYDRELEDVINKACRELDNG